MGDTQKRMEEHRNTWIKILQKLHPDDHVYADTNCCSTIHIDMTVKQSLDFINVNIKVSENGVEFQ